MQIPLQITFRHCDKSEAVEATIREHMEKLEQFHGHIMSGHVVVEMPDRHKHKGGLFSIHIQITIPGEDISVSRKQDDEHAHEDIYVTIRDAFKAARRQLEDRVRIEHDKVKHHELPGHGRISQLHPEQGYGRIEGSDGRDLYFHYHSVLDSDTARLQLGDEVRYTEEMGDEGPQASSVHLQGKHHIVG